VCLKLNTIELVTNPTVYVRAAFVWPDLLFAFSES